MIAVITLTLKYITIYLLSSLIVYHAVKKYTSSFYNENNFIIILSIIIGPLLTSWMFIQFIRFCPYYSDLTYISLLTITALTLLLILRPNLKNLFPRPTFASFQLFTRYDRMALLAIVITVSFVFFYFLAFSFIENDPLDYLFLAKLILEKKTVDFYPAMDGINTHGMIAPFTHPLGFPGFFAINMLGIADYNLAVFAVKLACGYYLIVSLIFFTYISREFGCRNIYIASLIYISTPCILLLTIRCHIDPYRILLFTLSTFTACKILKKITEAEFILLGVVTGLSWFIHSSGILNLFITVGLLCLYTVFNKGFLTSIKLGLWALLGCLVILTADLLQIYKATGRILGDTENIEVITLLLKHYQNFWYAFREIGNVKSNIIRFNVLFLQIQLFGITYTIFIMAVSFIFIKIRSLQLNEVQIFALLAISAFYGIAILLTLINVQVFIFNPRYLLQPIGLICLFAATIFNYGENRNAESN